MYYSERAKEQINEVMKQRIKTKDARVNGIENDIKKNNENKIVKKHLNVKTRAKTI